MSGFEFAVTYAVCWWLVLFMVLPHQADAPVKPGVGHAPSAPATPQLRKKVRWATVLAFIPAVALYFIVGEAKAAGASMLSTGEAEGSILKTGGKCRALAPHTPREDVSARDGYATGGKKVAPATLGGDNPYVPEHYDMPLRIPADGYLSGRPGQQTPFDDSFITPATVSVGRDGTTTINGKAVEPQATYGDDCPSE